MGLLGYLKSIFSGSSGSSGESQSYKQELTEDELNQVKNLAEDVKREYNLDYSPESLKELDKISKGLEDIPEPPLHSKDIIDDIDRFSCYVGEVALRNHDGEGKWIKADMGKHPGMKDVNFEVLVVRLDFKRMKGGPNVANLTKECLEEGKSFYEKCQEETTPPNQ